MILVPAIMTLLGREAWWMPRWMEPIVPHLQLEGSEATAAGEARSQPSAGAARSGGDPGEPRPAGSRTYSAVTRPRDGGPRDAGPRDAGPRDAGTRDAGTRDGGTRDGKPRGAEPRDTGRRDRRAGGSGSDNSSG
jgi:hypothetical protein